MSINHDESSLMQKHREKKQTTQPTSERKQSHHGLKTEDSVTGSTHEQI